jgi:hypothetical protein
MIHGVGVTVGQLKVPAGTTEVTQVEPLIDMIPVRCGRTLVTVDAAHTHATTAEALKGQRKIDFIMTVKSNQPNLLTELISRFKPVLASQPPEHVIEERGHGRKKRWSIWTLPADDLDFPHLQQIACIQREIRTLTGEYIAKEFAFPITSANKTTLAAAELNQHVRGHWGSKRKRTGSATPSGEKTITRPGREMRPTPWPPSRTSPSALSGSPDSPKSKPAPSPSPGIDSGPYRSWQHGSETITQCYLRSAVRRPAGWTTARRRPRWPAG